METIINNLEEMRAFAKTFVSDLKPGDVIGLTGELGAGKTTFVQMIGREMGIEEPMTSPTFVFRKEYPLQGMKLVHIDAYRIEGGNAEDLGELSEADAVTIIEWPEKIERLMPAHARWITIELMPGETRKIVEKQRP